MYSSALISGLEDHLVGVQFWVELRVVGLEDLAVMGASGILKSTEGRMLVDHDWSSLSKSYFAYVSIILRIVVEVRPIIHTDDRETASSAVGMVNPLIAEGVSNGSRKRSLVSVFVKLSAKSKETGSMSVGVNENKSMALS